MSLSFNRKPNQIIDSIPVFIDFENNIELKQQYGNYIENYKLISHDHVTKFVETGNHFIPEKIWKELEMGTISLINKYGKNNGTILDVGVGLGRLMSSVKDIQLDKHGIDISLNYLKYSKEQDIKVSMSLAEDLPYDNDVFDTIVCTDVLEHVLDINMALKEMLRTLKKGGILIIRVPYKEDLAKYLLPECKYDYVHLRNFDESNLYSLLNKVFKLNVKEITLAGKNTEYYRFKLFINDLPILNRISKLSYYFFKILEKYFSVKIQKYFYEYEINIVAQK